MAAFDPWTTTWACVDAWAVQAGAPALWQQRQGARLRALVEAARAGSAWWRQRLPELPAEGDTEALLQRLPISTRAELMAHFGGWVTDPALDLATLRRRLHPKAGEPARAGADVDDYAVWESSGSSGQPGLFVHDARSLAVADALQAVRGPWAALARRTPWLLPGLRVAFVGATDGPFASIVSLQRLRALNPWAAARTQAFNFMQPLPELLAALQAWQPAVLATYPSMAWVLARAQREGRLALRLHEVWTGGETLGAPWRSTIGQAFGCAVRDSYGASECLSIGESCDAGALHLQADWVILEAVDTHGHAVPEGTPGERTLLTYLANTVQPIIRYELGDRVRFVPGRCACGSPLPVIEVEGRSDDVLHLADATGHAVPLSPLALTAVLEEQAGVFDFRVSPRGTHALRLELFGWPREEQAAAQRAAELLRGFLQHQGVARPRVELRLQPAHSLRGRSGKLVRVAAHGRGP